MADDALARASQRYLVSVARTRGLRASAHAPDTTWQRVELAVLVGGFERIDSRTEAALTD